MPDWGNEVVSVVQLLLNAGALIGGVISWKLYIDNLRAAGVKDTTIRSVEKGRNHWH